MNVDYTKWGRHHRISFYIACVIGMFQELVRVPTHWDRLQTAIIITFIWLVVAWIGPMNEYTRFILGLTLRFAALVLLVILIHGLLNGTQQFGWGFFRLPVMILQTYMAAFILLSPRIIRAFGKYK